MKGGLETITVQPYWDGTTATARSVEGTGGVSTFDVPLGRLDHARVGRVVITSPTPSHVYWVRFWLSGTGRPIEKILATTPEAA